MRVLSSGGIPPPCVRRPQHTITTVTRVTKAKTLPTTPPTIAPVEIVGIGTPTLAAKLVAAASPSLVTLELSANTSVVGHRSKRLGG